MCMVNILLDVRLLHRRWVHLFRKNVDEKLPAGKVAAFREMAGSAASKTRWLEVVMASVPTVLVSTHRSI